MKITIEEMKATKAVIKIENTAPYFVNSLRRVMLAELPKLAINDVIIYDNTSPLFDEIIVHRLGLIPIPTDLKLLGFRKDCTCKDKGCPNCTVRYTLSKEGEGIVYSGDLQPEEKSLAIKEDTIPIVELSKDQRIILEVEAILGRGKDHAKWQAVQAPGYRFKTIITVDKKRMEDVNEFLAELPKTLAIELKGEELILKKPEQLAVLESYIDKNKVDFITIKRDPSTITFFYETDGALSAKDALEAGIDILLKKYEEFGEHIKKIK